MKSLFARRPIIGTTRRLPINGHYLAIAKVCNILYPFFEALLKVDGGNQREHPAKGIMRGNPIGQREKGLEPAFFGPAKFSDTDPTIGSADRPTNAHHENVDETMGFLAIDARIGQWRKSAQ